MQAQDLNAFFAKQDWTGLEAYARARLAAKPKDAAAQNLLGTDSPLGRLRGQVHRLDGLNLPAVVTYHPAYLLRTPADKRKAWEDLKFARRVFGELASVSVAARPAAGGPVAGH